MKILFVIDTLYTSNNGTSISAQRFAAELRQHGHEVRALCGDTPRTEQDAHITDGDFCTGIFHFPVFQFMCEKHDFFYANADRNLIRQACDWADIVHLYTPLFMSNAALNYCLAIHKPVTAAFHIQPENITSSFGLGHVQWINRMIYKIFRHVTYNRVQHVHTPSLFIARTLAKEGYNAQMHVISNGIHDDFIQAEEQRIYRTDDGLFRIMMIGRLSQEKRQDVIIRAMQYSKYADRILLTFAGRGPEYQRYVRMSRRLKNKPHFIYADRAKLIKELLHTDLYIHASDMEIEAISCIEAFATGLVPVIANSDQSATPQFALDERSLFMPGSPQDLAQKIDYWIEHPEERMAMQRCYHEAASQYTISRSIQLFESMLAQEINAHSANEITATESCPTVQPRAIKHQAKRIRKRSA